MVLGGPPGRCFVEQVFGDGLGDGHAVEGARATADLVEHDQAPRRGRTQDGRRFDHLDHEGAAAGGYVVVGADAREDAIDDADACRGGGHEASDLRQQHDQRHLPQVGTLARHVRTGQQQQARLRTEMGVVGNEPTRR